MSDRLKIIRSLSSPLVKVHSEYEPYTAYLASHADYEYIYQLLCWEHEHRSAYHNLSRTMTERDIWLRLAGYAHEGGFVAMETELYQHYERLCHLVMTLQLGANYE